MGKLYTEEEKSSMSNTVEVGKSQEKLRSICMITFWAKKILTKKILLHG